MKALCLSKYCGRFRIVKFYMIGVIGPNILLIMLKQKGENYVRG